MKSKFVIWAIVLFWFLAGALYYPKWKMPYSEAAISWDVSGYYHYLPAIFIYHDLKQQNWIHQINEKYLPSPAKDQAFGHYNSGNKVNKYAIGQAVLFSPFFLTAHAFTTISGAYPADGYSRPYQVAIWLGGFLASILGLILLRKILLFFFSDTITAHTLVALAIGTHWLEYAAISNGMNHTWLFTLLCGLILFTIRFYAIRDWVSAVGMGVCLGLGVLTRPTEIIWVFVPLLWGVVTLKDRVGFLLQQWKKVVVAGCIAAGILFIQFAYWKYVAGEWIIYTYGDQGFDWFSPAVAMGLKGVNTGWWLYTPLMCIAMFGWYGLFKKHRVIFWPVFITSVLAIYITLSWAHWQGGGGLGQRNMIQAYPLLAFPLAVVISWFYSFKAGKWIWVFLLIANMYYSLWWIHQAHQGGFFIAGQMTRAFFTHVVGRPHPDRDLFKLLDTPEYYSGSPTSIDTLHVNHFDLDTTSAATRLPDSTGAVLLSASNQIYGPVPISVPNSCTSWIRLEADFTVLTREWDTWKYAQWIVQFYDRETLVKNNMIRLHRLLPADQTMAHLFFDVRIPEEKFTRCALTVWNAESKNSIQMDNLAVHCIK